MMVVPLTCGAIITTFAPHTAEFFGSFTGALFTGADSLSAGFIFFFLCYDSDACAPHDGAARRRPDGDQGGYWDRHRLRARPPDWRDAHSGRLAGWSIHAGRGGSHQRH